MNIADLYTSRIQKSFDEDQVEILSTLQANLHEPLKLINYYKGLPISYPATIVAIDRGMVDMDVKAEQSFVIEQSRSSFIRTPLFQHDVFARAQYVSVKKGAVTFNKFSFVELVAEQRNFIRMVPDPHPAAVIESPLGTVEGEVHDISLTGVSIWIHRSCPLQKGSEMPIRFVLKTIDQSQAMDFRITGRLISISGDALPRNYKFAMTPDKLLERLLSQYIIQRQIEIIKEVKAATYLASRS